MGQSTTIQMNSHENAKTQLPSHPAPHHQARSGLMREVSTELEKKLESRHKERPVTVTSTSQVSARKGRAPATPRQARRCRRPIMGLTRKRTRTRRGRESLS